MDTLEIPPAVSFQREPQCLSFLGAPAAICAMALIVVR